MLRLPAAQQDRDHEQGDQTQPQSLQHDAEYIAHGVLLMLVILFRLFPGVATNANGALSGAPFLSKFTNSLCYESAASQGSP